MIRYNPLDLHEFSVSIIEVAYISDVVPTLVLFANKVCRTKVCKVAKKSGTKVDSDLSSVRD